MVTVHCSFVGECIEYYIQLFRNIFNRTKMVNIIYKAFDNPDKLTNIVFMLVHRLRRCLTMNEIGPTAGVFRQVINRTMQ